MAVVHGSFRPSSALLFSFLLTLATMADSVTDSEALLKLKQSFTGVQALDSWKPGTSPCLKNNEWVGVVCLNNGIVSGLRLNQMSLSGKIDVDALMQIPGLRTLSVSFNNFSGPIPDLNRLGALKAIFLTGNQFSGEISPDYFVKMGSLKKLWLSSNRFSGSIPLSLGQLPNLIELHLEGNQFSGVIPPLEQPSLASLDLSNNNLRGEIPESLSRFNLSSFQGNSALCGDKLGKFCPGTNDASATGEQKRLRVIAYVFLAASCLTFLFIVGGIIALRRRQLSESTMNEKDCVLDEPVGVEILTTGKTELSESETMPNANSNRKGSNRVGDLVLVNDEKGEFGMADLMKAAAEVLGNGTLGSSYKASMSRGLTVVVKRFKDMNKPGKDVFDGEIRRFGRLKHKNLMKPLAYHFRKEEKLLVHEYMPKGSLLYQLHGDRGSCHDELNWATRLKIIKGIAQGLGYLHTEFSYFEVPHGNLKSSNVLLSLENEPLLGDFGYCGLINDQAKQSLFAYKSPEVVQYQQVSPKCDVYSLGVIILELVTGKFPSQYISNGSGGTDVVQWAKSAMAEGRLGELFDPEIANSSGNSQAEMEQLLRIGAQCAEDNPDKRLGIREAIRRIEEIHQEEGSPTQKTVSLQLPDSVVVETDPPPSGPSHGSNAAEQGQGDKHHLSINIGNNQQVRPSQER